MRPIRRLEIACVGSGISADAGTAETIVENRKLRDPAAAFLVNGQAAPADTGWSARLDQVRWLHVAGTGGYVFSEAVTLHGLREDRTATWREINLKYGTDTSVTRPYLTLRQDRDRAGGGGLLLAAGTDGLRRADEAVVVRAPGEAGRPFHRRARGTPLRGRAARRELLDRRSGSGARRGRAVVASRSRTRTDCPARAR